MAKRRSTTTAIVRAVPVRAPAPVIRIAAPRTISAKPKRRTHRRHSSVGAMTGKTILGSAIGGAILGFLEKQFPKLPTVPVLGRAGTLALGAYLLSRQGGMGHSGILRDVAIAGAVVAGYQIGTTGKISGDVEGDVMGDGEISGIAAQV